jgi:hypothetical protein
MFLRPWPAYIITTLQFDPFDLLAQVGLQSTRNDGHMFPDSANNPAVNSGRDLASVNQKCASVRIPVDPHTRRCISCRIKTSFHDVFSISLEQQVKVCSPIRRCIAGLA